MSYTPGVGVGTSIGLRPGYKEPVTLSASQNSECAYLVVGDHIAEIRLERVHVEALHAQAPQCLAELDQADADAALCDKALETSQQVADLKGLLARMAEVAELTGDEERAEELGGMLRWSQSAIRTADAARQALEDAIAVLDQVAEHARVLTGQQSPDGYCPPQGASATTTPETIT